MEKDEQPQQHGGVTNYFQGATIHNLVINGNMTKTGPEYFNAEKQKKAGVTPYMVGRALKQCGTYIWGYAAYSVAFCVCRDDYEGWTDNAADFERKMREQGIDLPDGTVNSAMSRNPFMRYDTDKWDENGAMERVLKLRDEFRQQVAIAMLNNKLAG